MPFALPGEADQLSDSVVSLMDRFVRDIIRVIARNRAELENVEWRVLEQVLAAAFEGIGFDTHLTPPSKDGGKDIVLECVERGTRRRYIVEVKHWVCGKAVPGAYLKKFLNVIVNEKHDAGLFLSTSGFARNAYDALIHLEHKRMRVAGKDKIVHLCRLMVMREMGLWTTDMHLTEALFEQTDVLSGGGPRLPGAGTGEVPL
jgi:restriction endonuclease Mrr